MSSKFLAGDSNAGIIALLNDGSQTLNVSSIIDQGLIPNLPVCADGMKQLIGRQIGIADVNFGVITNPLTSDLNANTHNITNVTNLNSLPVADIITDSGTITSGHVVTGSGKTISDSGIIAANVITDSTNLVSGNLASANGNKTITDSGIIAANVITDIGTLTSGNVVTGNSGKTIQDSGTALSSLATNAALANYLPLAGGTMSGNIDMKSNTITVNSMSDNGTSGIIWGNGSTNPIPTGSIAIGDTNTIVGAIDTCVIGRLSNSSGNHSSLLGINNVSSVAGTNSVCVGYNNTVSADSTISIGFGNQSVGAKSICLGVGLTNNTANSLLIGSTVSNLVNIRSQTDATCDLGTTTNRFNNCYLAGVLDNTANLNIGTVSQTGLNIGQTGAVTTIVGTNVFIDGSSTMSIGSTNATNVFLGRSGQTVNSQGIFVTASQAYGSWYCTTSYSPAFTANVNRLIPPATSTGGSTSLFTYSAGVLTYTGTRTRRFRIDYNISYLLGASTANNTFWNSVNASTSNPTATQTSIFVQSQPSINATRIAVHFSDLISLSTNDSVQLACRTDNVTTSAISFDFVMCNIVGLFN